MQAEIRRYHEQREVEADSWGMTVEEYDLAEWFRERRSYRHPTKAGLVTVPMHPGDLPIGTLKSIEKASGIKLRR